MALSRSRYNGILLAGLLFFGMTLPLSKSAGNILLFLGYPIAAAGMLYYQDFKASVLSVIRQPLMLAFSLYFLVALVGVFFTEKYADGFHVANKFFSLPAIYLLVSVLVETVQDPEERYRNAVNIILSFLIGLMILNGIGVMTYFGIVGDREYVLPLAPLNVHHIWFSNINALGLYGAVSFLLFSRRGTSTGMKLFLFLSIMLAIICIFLSLSRTAWFGVALTSLIMTFLMIRNRKVLSVTVAAVAVACVVIYVFIPIIHERINTIISDITLFFSGTTESSLGHRFMMWKAALMMFLSNPITGVGTGGFVPTMIVYVKSGQFPESLLQYNQPHNMYLFALATNGIVGLAALLYLFYQALVFASQLIRGDQGERLFGFIAVATALHFLAAGCTDSLFNIQILRYSFVFIMAVCIRKSTTSATI